MTREVQKQGPEAAWTVGWRPYLLFALIAAVVYGRTVGFGYTYFDDDVIILKQFQSISSFTQIGHAFSSFILPPYYRPILTLSFMIDAAIGGNAPWIYHLSNCVYHLLTVCLVFYCLVVMGLPRLYSFIAGIVLAVHPLATHAVAWIPGRNDSLLAVFLLLAMITFLRLLKPGASPVKYMLHFVMFFCAMFTKETAVVFPLIALTWMVLNDRNQIRTARTGILAAGWIIIIIVWFAMRPALSIQDLNETDYYSASAFFSNVPLIFETFGKLIIPLTLSVYPKYSLASSIIGVVLVSVIFVLFVRRRMTGDPFLLFAILWMVLLLLPGMVVRMYDAPNRFDYVESRLYGPLAGFTFLLAGVICRFREIVRKIPVLMFAGIVIVLGFLTIRQSSAYQDPVSYWTQSTIDSPRAAAAHFSLGVVTMRLRHDPVSASSSYLAAIAIDPMNFKYHNNLGRSYEMMGRLDEAAKEYQLAMRLNPSDPMPPFNLGNALYRSGNYIEAERYWKMACSLDPNFTEARRRLQALQSSLHRTLPSESSTDAAEQ